MKNIFFICMFAAVAFSGCVDNDDDLLTGEINPGVEILPDKKPNEVVESNLFDIINLDYPGLEKVKAFYEAGEHYYAANALLEYYRSRTNIVNPNINLINPTITAKDQRIADQALEYRFYVRGFSESKDDAGVETYYSFWDASEKKINWTAHQDTETDQEFKYQRHRHQWMLPQAKAYRISKNEQYIQSWMEVYGDWLATYPYEPGTVFPPAGGSENNKDYEWKGLQVAERVLSQIDIMSYFIQSSNFTPEWLSTFLVAFEKEVECMRLNYYPEGNILLTQSQAVATAGILMPEFKNANQWTNEGLQKIGAELDKQFNNDGVQFELDLSYHIGAISDFRAVYLLAQANNKVDLLPGNFTEKLKAATEVVMNTIYPDYSIDNFNDTRSSSYAKSTLLNRLKEYAAMYPNDQELLWVATEGKSGKEPTHLTKAYDESGYYILRNGWKKESTMMILKNHNYSEWHSQPDNGTFGLYHNGRNFFPDAGVYAYSGADRTKFAATVNHNTLTVMSKSIGGDQGGEIKGKLLKLETKNNVDILVTENPSFTNTTHRRTVFFIDKKFFVIVDEGYGKAVSSLKTNLNFHLLDDENTPSVFEKYTTENPYCQAYTTFDGNNMLARTFAETKVEESKTLSTSQATDVSNAMGTISGLRLGYQITVRQPASTNDIIMAARYITVIHPFETATDREALDINATFTDNEGGTAGTFHPEGASIKVTVKGTVYNLSSK